jgi:hypothetical protein
VSHLFTGHELTIGQSFAVEGTNSSTRRSVSVSVEDVSSRQREDEADLLPDEEALPQRRMALKIRTNNKRRQHEVSLSRQGGLDQRIAEVSSSRPWRPNQDSATNVHFVTTESFPGNELIRHWDRIQLTANEELVLQALRFIDGSIEQIRSYGTGSTYGHKGGFIIKRQKEALPFPLGSLGDGAWRMLTLAIVLTQCAGGMLFIDEIDTGLHYTVMSDMWRLIFEAAKQFDVQVFASTHSYDCVHSLSTICRSGGDPAEAVTIQRIEAARSVSVPFSESEIQIAAERHIEIR